MKETKSCCSEVVYRVNELATRTSWHFSRKGVPISNWLVTSQLGKVVKNIESTHEVFLLLALKITSRLQKF